MELKSITSSEIILSQRDKHCMLLLIMETYRAEEWSQEARKGRGKRREMKIPLGVPK
jgi:hypothetical protein